MKNKPNLADCLSRNLEKLMEGHATLRSNQALGDRSGVGRSTIQRIRAKEVFPTLDKIEKIAEAFGITVGELLSAGDGPGASRQQSTKALDDIMEITSLYQQSSAEGREFILDAARSAHKVSSALWKRVRTTED